MFWMDEPVSRASSLVRNCNVTSRLSMRNSVADSANEPHSTDRRYAEYGSNRVSRLSRIPGLSRLNSLLKRMLG